MNSFYISVRQTYEKLPKDAIRLLRTLSQEVSGNDQLLDYTFLRSSCKASSPAWLLQKPQEVSRNAILWPLDFETTVALCNENRFQAVLSEHSVADTPFLIVNDGSDQAVGTLLKEFQEGLPPQNASVPTPEREFSKLCDICYFGSSLVFQSFVLTTSHLILLSCNTLSSSAVTTRINRLILQEEQYCNKWRFTKN